MHVHNYINTHTCKHTKIHRQTYRKTYIMDMCFLCQFQTRGMSFTDQGTCTNILTKLSQHQGRFANIIWINLYGCSLQRVPVLRMREKTGYLNWWDCVESLGRMPSSFSIFSRDWMIPIRVLRHSYQHIKSNIKILESFCIITP